MSAPPFGKYALLEKLGSGSTASVWRAHDSELSRPVALKLLHSGLASDAGAVRRFRDEARVASMIPDEHVAQVLEVGLGPGSSPYIAMELLEGAPLTQRTGRPVGTAAAVEILSQICAAMQVAHQHGVVHRDLKPDHIFLCPRPGEPSFVKVIDFGSADIVDPSLSGARSPGELVRGTPQYMAPEQCGTGPVDCRADLYAIGVIAYELVTGRVPFDAVSVVEVMIRQRDEKPMPPYEYEPSVPEALSDIILRALSKRPEDRFSTAAEMASALASVRVRDGRVPELRAHVRLRGGRSLLEARCTELMTGGAYLATPDTVPPMGEALSVTLYCDGYPIEVPSEVSMHAGGGAAPGFAVRFMALDPIVQGLVDRVLRGDPMPRHTVDPELVRLTRDHRRGTGMEDFYALLALPTGANRRVVMRRARVPREARRCAALCPLEARAGLPRAHARRAGGAGAQRPRAARRVRRRARQLPRGRGLPRVGRHAHRVAGAARAVRALESHRGCGGARARRVGRAPRGERSHRRGVR